MELLWRYHVQWNQFKRCSHGIGVSYRVPGGFYMYCRILELHQQLMHPCNFLKHSQLRRNVIGMEYLRPVQTTVLWYVYLTSNVCQRLLLRSFLNFPKVVRTAPKAFRLLLIQQQNQRKYCLRSNKAWLLSSPLNFYLFESFYSARHQFQFFCGHDPLTTLWGPINTVNILGVNAPSRKSQSLASKYGIQQEHLE